MVSAVESIGLRGGCPIGTLAADLADTDETARTMLSAAFGVWCEQIRSALARLRERDLLEPGADLDRLAVGTLAAMHQARLKVRASLGDATLVAAAT